MKQLQDYVNEKLSLSDNISRLMTKVVFGKKFARTQSEVAKYLKDHVEEWSDNKISVSIMRVKEIEANMNNCINKDDELIIDTNITIEQGIKRHEWYNQIEIIDETPFACFYAKDNKDKFYLYQDSVFYFSHKDEEGNRPLKHNLYFINDGGSETSVEYFFRNIVIPRILDPEKWEEEQKELTKQRKEEQKKNTEARIKAIEKELEDLKKQIKESKDMKSLIDYIKEAKLDFDDIEEAAAKVVKKLKKNKKWVDQAELECRMILKDDPEEFEEKLLNDHSAAPAIWKLIVMTAEMLKEDPDELYEEFGLYSFHDAISSELFYEN